MSKLRVIIALCCIFACLTNTTILYAQDKMDPVEQPGGSKIIDTSVPEVPEPVENDSLTTPNLTPDTLNTEALVDSLNKQNGTQDFAAIDHQIELKKKDFKGSGIDITIGAITIASWLVMMYLAANQRD